jgi:imidazolonepropionase
MPDNILITNASQLLTLSGPERPRLGDEMLRLGIIEDGAVLIQDGTIAAIGKPSDLVGTAEPGHHEIDAAGCVVMPGFVDAHTHPVFAGTREDEYEMRAAGLSYKEIASRGGGILSTVHKTRAATEAQLFDLALPRIAWFLKYGTTTIEAKSGYGLTVEDELKILRVIRRLSEETPLDLVPTFLGAHEIPLECRPGNPEGRSRQDYLNLVTDEMLPLVAREGLARYCDVFCESHVFNAEESLALMTRAKELGLEVRMHAEQLSSSGGAELAAKIGAATADHLEWIDSDGIRELARAGVTAVLLPGAVFNLGLTRYAPAREMIEAGVPIVLATDFNPGSSPTPSMQIVHSIACTQMRMTPAECVTASTINAAYSVGRGDRIGSLEPGKQADVIIYNCTDYRQIPYFYGVNHVRTVIKGGGIVYGG